MLGGYKTRVWASGLPVSIEVIEPVDGEEFVKALSATNEASARSLKTGVVSRS